MTIVEDMKITEYHSEEQRQENRRKFNILRKAVFISIYPQRKIFLSTNTASNKFWHVI